MIYNREQIKEWILTDYLDGQLDVSVKKEIDECIARDPELKALYDEVCAAAGMPLQSEADFDGHPPEQIWKNIKARIETSHIEVEHSSTDVWTKWLEQLGGLWGRPRLSLALGSVMAVLVMVTWIGMGQMRVRPAQYNSSQQMEYLMEMVGADVDMLEEDNGGFDTAIEEYFLMI